MVASLKKKEKEKVLGRLIAQCSEIGVVVHNVSPSLERQRLKDLCESRPIFVYMAISRPTWAA